MVTDQAGMADLHHNVNKYFRLSKHICIFLGYIGTSNWAEDYFTDTAGTCITFEPESILNPLVESAQQKLNLVQEMEMIFQRDWSSSLSKHI